MVVRKRSNWRCADVILFQYFSSYNHNASSSEVATEMPGQSDHVPDIASVPVSLRCSVVRDREFMWQMS